MATRLNAKQAADRAAKKGTAPPAPRPQEAEGPGAKDVKRTMLEAGRRQDPRNPDSWMPPGT